MLNAEAASEGQNDTLARLLQYLHTDRTGAVTLPGYKKFNYDTGAGSFRLLWDNECVVLFGLYDDEPRGPVANIVLGTWDAREPGKHLVSVTDEVRTFLSKHPSEHPLKIATYFAQYALKHFDVVNYSEQRRVLVKAAAEPETSGELSDSPIGHVIDGVSFGFLLGNDTKVTKNSRTAVAQHVSAAGGRDNVVLDIDVRVQGVGVFYVSFALDRKPGRSSGSISVYEPRNTHKATYMMHGERVERVYHSTTSIPTVERMLRREKKQSADNLGRLEKLACTLVLSVLEKSGQAQAAAEPYDENVNLPANMAGDEVFRAFFSMKKMEKRTVQLPGHGWSLTVDSVYRGADHADQPQFYRPQALSLTFTVHTAKGNMHKVKVETTRHGMYKVTVDGNHLQNSARVVHTLTDADFKRPVTIKSALLTVCTKLGLTEKTSSIKLPAARFPQWYLKDCVHGYIEAALNYERLASADENDDENYSTKYSFLDVTPAGIDNVEKYVRRFLEHVYPQIQKARDSNSHDDRQLSGENVGNWIYLSHVGSGGGFNEQTFQNEHLADILDDAADSIFPGDCEIYETGDGKVSFDLR